MNVLEDTHTRSHDVRTHTLRLKRMCLERCSTAGQEFEAIKDAARRRLKDNKKKVSRDFEHENKS